MNAYKILYSLLFIVSTLVCTEIRAGGSSDAVRQKAAACFSCHGKNGNSNNPLHPILAGQQAKYLQVQLTAFKKGARKNAMMQGIASSLKKEDINNLATFFADQKPNSAGGDNKLASSGKTKFSMCAGCHGFTAKGRGIFPRLAGQHPAYIAKQLHNFKDGSRQGGPMQAFASGLSEQDINEIAAYLGTLQ